jgi:hypothetical protein
MEHRMINDPGKSEYLLKVKYKTAGDYHQPFVD